ncbi:hypothetical protein BGI41_04905 [Methanobrevibacter sp. 87.7]|nr:hypothetical protein BGI41_04905 [Methanobrevibacter sp. 87.7]
MSISEGGSCGYVKWNNTKFWAGGHCYTLLNVDENKILNKFLYQILKNDEKKLMRLGVGSGLKNIQKLDVENFKIKLPSIKEQNKISKFLNFLDLKINKCFNEIILLKRFKKGLLQKMFC